MINKLRSVAKTELIKTSFFTSLSTLVKIATTFVLNKVLAVYLGPAGVAFIAQFNNFFGITSAISTGGVNSGVIKYISENREDKTNTRNIISTATFIIVLCSLLTAAVVFLFAGYFSNLLFKSQQYKFILNLLAVSLIFVSLNSLLMSVLNGHKEIKKYTWANIISSLLMLVLSLLLVVNYKLTGVLIALVASQSLVFIITLLFILKSQWFKIRYFLPYFDKHVLKKLSGFMLMTLVSSFTGPVSLIIIRNYIGSHLSWKEAGYWQGVWTISEVYLMFITSSLSVYYLPRLAEITDRKELKKEIISTSKIILPIISGMALLIFIIKVPLVNILFTEEFKPMLPLFKYQLSGDVIKIASWLIAFQMVSRAMTRLFIFTEVVFSFLFVIISIACINYFGLEGAAIGFCILYSLYFLTMFFIFRKLLFPFHDDKFIDQAAS